jgi:hypothetical protein
MTINILTEQFRRHDTQHNDTQSDDIQHNDTQPNDIQHNDTKRTWLIYASQHKRHSITTFNH